MVGWVEAIGTNETGAGASRAGAQFPRKAGFASFDWSTPLFAPEESTFAWLSTGVLVVFSEPAVLRLDRELEGAAGSSSFPLRLPLDEEGLRGELALLSRRDEDGLLTRVFTSVGGGAWRSSSDEWSRLLDDEEWCREE